MKKKSTRQFYIIALLLSFVIGITIHFPMILNYLSSGGQEGHHRHGERALTTFSHLGSELLITCLVAFSLFVLNFFIIKPVKKHSKLNLKQIGLSIFLTIVTVIALNYLFFSFQNLINPDNQYDTFFDEFISINFFVSALVIGSTFIIRLVYQKQTIQIENEILRAEAIQSQYESLKNQVSPHFLFNSLTALKELVNENPENAQDYINHLSKTLRYTLQSNEKKLVTLKEELDFTDSYLFLIKIRFNSNLIFKSEIDPEMLNFRLPPLTIQTLIENAVKHNEISKRKPLTIKIQTREAGNLMIWNIIQEKLTPEQGAGIGLANLSKQFQLLLKKDIIITKENNEFRVEIPLINPKSDEGIDN